MVEFEEGFDEYNPTIEEVIKFLLLRGAGRFSKEELPYFCQELGRDPSYDIDEGRDKKYATTSTIRAQLATWKKNFVQDSMPLSSEAVSNLQETLDNMGVTPTTELTELLESKKNPSGNEVSLLLQAYDADGLSFEQDISPMEAVFNAVPYETGAKRDLPHVVGILATGPKMNLLDVVAVMLDTGATVSLINFRAFRQLGLSADMVDRRVRPRVATAARGVIYSEGFLNTRLYMRSINHKYPYVRANFLVIDSETMPAVVLGHGELVEGRYNLGFEEGDYIPLYALKILAYSEQAKQPTMQTIPVIQPDSLRLHNTMTINAEQRGRRPRLQMVNFVTETAQPLGEHTQVRLISSNPNVTFEESQLRWNLRRIRWFKFSQKISSLLH